jgi:hypothetical protein
VTRDQERPAPDGQPDRRTKRHRLRGLRDREPIERLYDRDNHPRRWWRDADCLTARSWNWWPRWCCAQCRRDVGIARRMGIPRAWGLGLVGHKKRNRAAQRNRPHPRLISHQLNCSNEMTSNCSTGHRPLAPTFAKHQMSLSHHQLGPKKSHQRFVARGDPVMARIGRPAASVRVAAVISEPIGLPPHL